MTRLVIHVGPHKTGSTAVQHFLAASRPVLAGLGLPYPLPTPSDGEDINHNALALAMQRQPIACLDELVEWSIVPGGAAVLSAEEFSNVSSAALLENLRTLEAARAVQYVFVARDDADRFTSSMIHTLVERPEAILDYGTLDDYAAAMARFSRQQVDIFRAKGATFLDYSELASTGIGRGFAEATLGVRLAAPEHAVNQAREHLVRIADRRAIWPAVAKFLGTSEIVPILNELRRGQRRRHPDPAPNARLVAALRAAMRDSLARVA